MKVSINNEQKLFIISCGEGFTCFGFANCFKESDHLAKITHRLDLLPNENEIGSLHQYDNCQELVKIACKSNLGVIYPAGTSRNVQNILEESRSENCFYVKLERCIF